MKEIELEQGSSEWIRYRLQHIGATCASSVMEINPWRSKYDLWREKVGVANPVAVTKTMEQGVLMEPIARKWYEALKGESFIPLVVEHDAIHYLSASLDGISVDRKRVVEIKCGAKSFSMAREGRIPDYYICQIQHQILITGVDQIDYVAFNGSTGFVIPVKRDDAFLENLVRDCEAFWYCVQNFISPLTLHRKYQEVAHEDARE